MMLALSSALPAFAQATIDVPCIQNAIEVRETAISNAIDTFAFTVKAALVVRKNALKAAWTLTTRDARRDAIRAARQTFDNAVKDAIDAKKDAKKTAASTFKTTMKDTCHQNPSDTTMEGSDGKL